MFISIIRTVQTKTETGNDKKQHSGLLVESRAVCQRSHHGHYKAGELVSKQHKAHDIQASTQNVKETDETLQMRREKDRKKLYLRQVQIIQGAFFTARCTLVQSAVLRLLVVCLSVRL